jgi:hypothetical protein
LFRPAPPRGRARNIDVMGRIGKTYPRFEQTPRGVGGPPPEQWSRPQLVGAAIGVLAALAFIGWVLTR